MEEIISGIPRKILVLLGLPITSYFVILIGGTLLIVAFCILWLILKPFGFVLEKIGCFMFFVILVLGYYVFAFVAMGKGWQF